MVIDFHTHVFHDKIAEWVIESLVKSSKDECKPCSDGTVSGLLKNMDEFGVDISVVQPIVTKVKNTEVQNYWAKEITSHRIISFGSFHPETDDYKRDIDLICNLGLPGIKLHPEFQQFYIDDPKMMKAYDYALSKGLILLFHAGYDPSYPPPVHSTPQQFAKISKEMQGGIIIAAHLGGQRQWDDVEKYLVGTDVYFDTSMGMDYYPHEQFLRIVKNHGADKILFGSDSPWNKAGDEVDTLNSLPLAQEEKDLILYKNAMRILNGHIL